MASRMSGICKFPEPITRHVVDQIRCCIACWKEEKRDYKICEKQFPIFIFSIFIMHFISKSAYHISMFSNFKIDFIFGFSVVDLLYMELIWTRFGHEFDEKNRFKKLERHSQRLTMWASQLTRGRKIVCTPTTHHLWGKK
jgi:hypothetical protein